MSRRLAGFLGALTVLIVGAGLLAGARSVQPVPAGGWHDSGGGGGISEVACASPSWCVGLESVAQENLATIWNGKGWGEPVDLPRFEDYVALSCPAVGSCLALNAIGGTLELAGGAWRVGGDYDAALVGAPYGEPSASLACTDLRTCVAVNGAGDEVSLASGRWQRPIAIDRAPLTGIACPAPGSCVAVDGDGRILVSTNGRFGAPVPVDADALQSVACASATFCAVADLAGTVRVGSPIHLGRMHPLGGAPGEPVAVACPAQGVCVAAGPENGLSVFSGNHWHVLTRPADRNLSSMEVESVSCPVGWQDFCAVSDGMGDVRVGGSPFA